MGRLSRAASLQGPLFRGQVPKRRDGRAEERHIRFPTTFSSLITEDALHAGTGAFGGDSPRFKLLSGVGFTAPPVAVVECPRAGAGADALPTSLCAEEVRPSPRRAAPRRRLRTSDPRGRGSRGGGGVGPSGHCMHSDPVHPCCAPCSAPSPRRSSSAPRWPCPPDARWRRRSPAPPAARLGPPPAAAVAAAAAACLPSHPCLPQRRPASAKASPAGGGSGGAGYAAVYHGDAYEDALHGRHGDQLRLAIEEGEGKDDPPYDPFALLLADEEGDVGEASGEYDGLIEGEDGGAAADGDAAATAADGPLSDDEDEDDFDLSPYNADGSVSRPRSELVALKSGLPAGGLFAVIRLGGSQEKVTVDDVVVVNKLKPVDRWAVGETITLTGPDVLLAGSTHLTLVGLPGVAAAEVDVMVEEITKDAKVLVFKKRKRKNSRRLNGFRREVTLLRVTDIRLAEEYADLGHKERI